MMFGRRKPPQHKCAHCGAKFDSKLKRTIHEATACPERPGR